MTKQPVMKIFIDRCSVKLRVGVRDKEKLEPQRVIVSVEAEGPLTQAFRDPQNADLETVIDYSRIHAFVSKELPQKPHTPLLESVAQQIVDFCLTDPRVEKVRVKLEKPDIYRDCESVGVEMVLSREECAIRNS